MRKSIILVGLMNFSQIKSAFDAASLLHADLQADEIADTYVPIPEGEYAIQFGAPDIKSGEKSGRTWARLEVPAKITDPAVAHEMGLTEGSELKAYYTIFLDLNENNMLDFGVNRNVALGRFLKAVGLKEGEVKLSEIENRTAIGKFKQKINQETGRVRTELVDVFAEE